MVIGLASFILFAISAVHFYWTFGGRKAISLALPEQNGKAVLSPGPAITFIVAVCISCIGLVFAATAGQFVLYSDWPWLFPAFSSLFALIFLLRAIGDFNWVGFFKRPNKSRFAKLDTNVYSPLCVFLALAGFMPLVAFLVR